MPRAYTLCSMTVTASFLPSHHPSQPCRPSSWGLTTQQQRLPLTSVRSSSPQMYLTVQVYFEK